MFLHLVIEVNIKPVWIVQGGSIEAHLQLSVKKLDLHISDMRKTLDVMGTVDSCPLKVIQIDCFGL